jgi:hypothetical protein
MEKVERDEHIERSGTQIERLLRNQYPTLNRQDLDFTNGQHDVFLWLHSSHPSKYFDGMPSVFRSAR